jgi:hypothetical protein
VREDILTGDWIWEKLCPTEKQRDQVIEELRNRLLKAWAEQVAEQVAKEKTRYAIECILEVGHEFLRQEDERERERTARASQKLTERGHDLEVIILDALARVMGEIRPAYPKKRRYIITRVLDETNKKLKELKDSETNKERKKRMRAKVGRPCVRKRVTTYWKQNPNLAPPK